MTTLRWVTALSIIVTTLAGGTVVFLMKEQVAEEPRDASVTAQTEQEVSEKPAAEQEGDEGVNATVTILRDNVIATVEVE